MDDSWYNNKGTGYAIQGIGSLASAWGQYESDKTKNKLLRDDLNYQKEKDDIATAKNDKAQSNLDNAFASSDFNINKKKYDSFGNEIVDDTSTAVG